MQNREILERAITKAIDGGWHALLVGGADWWREASDYQRHERVLGIINPGMSIECSAINILIFNHDFAKALWGETDEWFKTGIPGASRGYRHHLQYMVIADDPLEYLGENI